MPTERVAHWDRAYVDAQEHSWDQRSVERSVELLDTGGLPSSVIDIGGGTSPLAGTLLDLGVSDVTVLDISAAALERAAAQLGARATEVRWVTADVTRWEPDRRYEAWHDRATFHFLTDPADRAAYRERLHAAVAPGGRVVVATFAPDGPAVCSGLPVVRYDAADLVAALDLRDAVDRREVHTTPWATEQTFTWVAGHLPVCVARTGGAAGDGDGPRSPGG